MEKIKKRGPLGVGIIGCGLIGEKRANALGSNGRLLGCVDLEVEKSKKIAQKFGCKDYADYESLLADQAIDLVIISTLHDSLVPLSIAAVKAGKHILVEKPAARNPRELSRLVELAKTTTVKIRVGFNHRFHHSLRKAKELIEDNALGELHFIRARYGHGGRLGYDKEWRSNPLLSGGGELIDQGPHLIDLSRWFLGDFSEINGFAVNYFWDMPVDDNGFMLLKTPSNKAAFLQVSCTEWKNLFSMEIYGTNGKIDLNGLGGSYGVEKCTFYKMLPQMGPPETISWEYPMKDNSWEYEIEEFYKDIWENRAPNPGLEDAMAALKIIEKIYKDSGYDHRT